MKLEDVLEKNYVRALIEKTCGLNHQLLKRNDSFAVRKDVENERDIYRVIILPPRGFTANGIEQMNSHDEAEFATIEIKGVVREDKKSFSKLQDCLYVVTSAENGDVSALNQPYITYDFDNKDPKIFLEKHSAGKAPFHVVRSNGYGFYHNLINATDDWLVLKLHKRLRPAKKVSLDSFLTILDDETAKILKGFYRSIVDYGDGIFEKNKTIVNKVLDLPLNKSLPALCEMLHVHDSGMHEACTVFATILKIGKQHPDVVIPFIEQVIENETIPTYYGHQLIGKISGAASVRDKELKEAA